MSGHALFLTVAFLLCAAECRLVQAWKKSYVVYLGAHMYGRDASVEDHARATESHHELLGSVLGSKQMARDAIFYSYTKNINGFAAYLDEEVATQMARHPEVVTVMESKMLKLHTTRSWDFMDMERDGQILPDSIWKHAKFGQNIIIANLDSGVWPESNSFSDEGMEEVPRRWKGSCSDSAKYGVPCNKKLIGANSFFHEPVTLGSLHATIHGASVVCSAGNSGPFEDTVVNAAPWVTTVAASTVDRDFPNQITLGNSAHMKGMSLESSDLHSDKLFPVINASSAALPNCTVNLASSCAMGCLDPGKVKGKIVVCVRGGDIPRVMKGMAVLSAGGAGMILANGEMDGNDVEADPHVLPATMITYSEAVSLYKYMASSSEPVANISPSKTELGVKNSPSMAAFSSRGPSGTLPYVLKPDIAAPGVDILAAFTEYVSPTEVAADKRRSEYAIMSGTSMACPHVSGVIGLLKAARPEWSPAAMRSAIMTTARTQDNTGAPMREQDGKEATAFAYGAGNVHPNRAVDPGLVYDVTPNDYFTFLCSLGFTTKDLSRLSAGKFACPAKPPPIEDLNYPSIVVPELRHTMTVKRRLKNVGRFGTYRASWRAPFGINMTVDPTVLVFQKTGEEKEFKVTVTSQKDKLGRGYVFGKLVWSDGVHYVRSPVVVNALD
ncbi:subtilisin-like protease SBT5.3 [Lolium rigidum]|uniref:subtilisin-like protease SBT5.3 n=1 Tax=Lolium rigidum TaxID=89674 RepID=UPI001F5CE367|nr:subtilisin-like protease SBT5.3 [Lolium rigidum]